MQELRDLVASVAETQKREAEKTDRQFRETDQRLEVLGAEVDRLLAEAAQVVRANAPQLQATDRQLQETSQRRRQETDREIQETARQIREVGRKLRGLGDKFGGFTEGMALPAMTKILMERFGMTFVAPRVRKRMGDRWMELDVLAYSNLKANEAYVVRVKGRLREDGLEQLQRTLAEFREFFPEHAGKTLYGILAAVDVSADMAARTLRAGIYLARIHDDQFDLQVPAGFEPRPY